MGMVTWLLLSALCAVAVAQNGQSCEMIADVVYVIDSSNSIGPENWLKVKEFFAELTKLLEVHPEKVRIGASVFSYFSKIRWKLDTYDTSQGVLYGVEQLPFMRSMTNTAGGLAKALQIYKKSSKRPEADKIVILLTDGVPTRFIPMAEPRAEQVKASGARLITIGVTSHVDEDQLKRMASKDQNGQPFYLYVQDFSKLAEEISPMMQQICAPILPENPPPTPGACDKLLEVVITMDASGSIPFKAWPKYINFVQNLVRHFDIGAVRVGMVKFATKAEILWTLDDYYIKAENEDHMQDQNKLVIEVGHIQKTWGWTNMQMAFEYTQNVFEQSTVREGAPRVIIFLTDGRPTIVKELTEEKYNTMISSTGAKLLVIGIGRGIDAPQLETWASADKQNKKMFWRIGKFGQLKNFVQEIHDETCNV